MCSSPADESSIATVLQATAPSTLLRRPSLLGTAPAVLANGGSMIADAYSTEEEAEAEQQQLVGA